MDRARYLLGLVTLILAIAGGVFLYDLLANRERGERFRLHLEFRSVRGLKNGADVRLRGVTIGSVRRVRLADDGKRGIVDLVIDAGHERHCCFNSKFWIVAPRFSGLTGGASGLDTLIRDAYLAFATPDPSGPPLPSGSLLPGSERPALDDDEQVAAAARGDLLMTLLVPENHALYAGSRVMFRGVAVGDVRSVELGERGAFVRVGVRVDRDHRATVTDRTRFWIARPRLTGALLSGIDVQDVGALLGTYIAYFTETGAGLPVPDGYVTAATAERPDNLKLTEVPAGAVQNPQRGADKPPDPEALQLVRVAYSAVGKNWWSPDDHVQREGTGLLYEDRSGRLVVVTARSLCDAEWCLRDVFGMRAKFHDEKFRVLHPDGTVLRAGRSWVEPTLKDLAVLLVEDIAQGVPVTPGRLIATSSRSPGAPVALQAYKERAPDPPSALDPAQLPKLDTCRGALVLEGGLAIGLLGQKAARDETAVIVALEAIPDALRPK